MTVVRRDRRAQGWPGHCLRHVQGPRWKTQGARVLPCVAVVGVHTLGPDPCSLPCAMCVLLFWILTLSPCIFAVDCRLLSVIQVSLVAGNRRRPPGPRCHLKLSVSSKRQRVESFRTAPLSGSQLRTTIRPSVSTNTCTTTRPARLGK